MASESFLPPAEKQSEKPHVASVRTSWIYHFLSAPIPSPPTPREWHLPFCGISKPGATPLASPVRFPGVPLVTGGCLEIRPGGDPDVAASPCSHLRPWVCEGLWGKWLAGLW